jgi:polysaccharide biosynthesis protein PslG
LGRAFFLAIVLAVAVTPAASAADHEKHQRGCPRALTHCALRLGKPHKLIPGLNDDWHVRTDQLAFATQAGARVIRFPLDWATVQPRDSTRWNWRVYDRMFAAARAQGLGVILDPTDAPCWAHPALGCPNPLATPAPPDPAFEPQWELFINRAVRRYPDVTALEVWNEPNSYCFWSGGPDPARYTALLKGAFRAARSVRPDVPVLFGGLVPQSFCGPGVHGYLDFLRKAYAAGAAGSFDALALHPYPLPFGRSDYREEVLRLIAKARAVVAQKQGKKKGSKMPVWITEIGMPTAGNEAVSEQDQALRLGALYGLLARVPNLPVVVIHRMFDQPGEGEQENGFGLLRSDLSSKPAFQVMEHAFGHYYRLKK